MGRSTEPCTVWRYDASEGMKAPAEDAVAAEEPLEIRVAGRSVSITMRTPGHDDELALGFLVGEGLIRGRGDVVHVRPCDIAQGGSVDVLVAPHVPIDFASLTRHVFASSSCGVCGSATIDAVCRRWPRLDGGPRVSASTLLSLPTRLRAGQAAFDRTGGIHAAGLFSEEGLPLAIREDVGRHNAIDKLVGRALLDSQLPLERHLLMVSGRISFEIVQKALAAGIRLVAAVSAPSSLAVDLATETGITLVGFLREGRFNVYSHPHRIDA
ncbi:MAG: formate dehydrogenase accessory sulfurtransferase FdhD [Planctomycetota bacterium]